MKLPSLALLLLFVLSLSYSTAQDTEPTKQEYQKLAAKQLQGASNTMLGGMVLTGGGLVVSYIGADNKVVRNVGLGTAMLGGVVTVYGIAMIGQAGKSLDKGVALKLTPVIDSEGIGICWNF